MRGLALVLALVLISACSPGNTESPQVADSTNVALPPRPRDIRINGVEPCSLLDDKQRAALGLGGASYSSTKPSRLFRGDLPLCSINGMAPQPVSVGIGVVTSAGIELFTTKDAFDASIRTSTIEGYPAVVMTPRHSTKFCDVIVDVATGQLLNVHYADGGQPPPVPQDGLCKGGEAVAAAAMHTLISR